MVRVLPTCVECVPRAAVAVCRASTDLQADAGVFQSVQLSAALQQIVVTFAPAADTPAGMLSYRVLRLRADKVSLPSSKRPGRNFTVSEPAGVTKARGAFEIPARPGAVAVTIRYAHDV